MKYIAGLCFIFLLSCRQDECSSLRKQKIDLKNGTPEAIQTALRPLSICGIDSFERSIILAPAFEDTLLQKCSLHYEAAVYFIKTLRNEPGYDKMKEQIETPSGEFLSVRYKVTISPLFRSFLEKTLDRRK